jgi:hypothetical protein
VWWAAPSCSESCVSIGQSERRGSGLAPQRRSRHHENHRIASPRAPPPCSPPHADAALSASRQSRLTPRNRYPHIRPPPPPAEVSQRPHHASPRLAPRRSPSLQTLRSRLKHHRHAQERLVYKPCQRYTSQALLASSPCPFHHTSTSTKIPRCPAQPSRYRMRQTQSKGPCGVSFLCIHHHLPANSSQGRPAPTSKITSSASAKATRPSSASTVSAIEPPSKPPPPPSSPSTPASSLSISRSDTHTPSSWACPRGLRRARRSPRACYSRARRRRLSCSLRLRSECGGSRSRTRARASL